MNTTVENNSVCPTCHKPMLVASASLSDGDQVSDDTDSNIVPVEQVSDEADQYKFKYNIEVYSKKDLGINMAGVGKIIIFK